MIGKVTFTKHFLVLSKVTFDKHVNVLKDIVKVIYHTHLQNINGSLSKK